MAVNNDTVPMPVRNEGVSDRSDIPTMSNEGLNIMYGVKNVDVSYANFGAVCGHEINDPAMAQIAANTSVPDTPNQPIHIMAYASGVRAQHANFTFVGGNRYGAPPVRVPPPRPVHVNVRVPQANVADSSTMTRVQLSETPVVNPETPTNATQNTNSPTARYSEKVPQRAVGDTRNASHVRP